MKKITPHLVEKPWGGDYLARFYKSPKKNIGEAWLLSTLKDGESEIEGQKLSTYLGRELTYLIKILDAKEPLSIQVHPNDEWAQKLEGSRGKTECWLILDSQNNGGVYLGLKKGVEIADFEKAIRNNEAVDAMMNFYPTKKGDFISVPAGTIHAIGAGVTLLEVQQSSGITYRLWDWNRPGRELHIDKGMKVCDVTDKFEFKRDVLGSMKRGLLLKHTDFTCSLNEHEGQGWFIDLKTYEVYPGDKPQSESYLFVR